MGWCCDLLKVTFDEQYWNDSEKKDLLSFIEEEYEEYAASIYLEDGCLYVSSMYCDPDFLLKDIIKKYKGKYFEAVVNATYENSGEMKDINYTYNGKLKSKESEIYTKRDKIGDEIKELYVDCFSVLIEWKNEIKVDADNVVKGIWETIFDRLSDHSITKEKWFDMIVWEKEKKYANAYCNYPVVDNNLFDFCDENELLEIFKNIENDDFDVYIYYTYVDTSDDIKYYLRLQKKKKFKVTKEAESLLDYFDEY